MLLALRIANFALIDRLDLTFEHGFNVLTGETGAGKSIIVDALGLLLGGRASAEMVREGCDEAVVEALFDLSERERLLAELDARGSVDDGQVLLSRCIAASGRSRCQINGRLATVGAVAKIGRRLVELHGQHEHQSVVRAERQRALLDAFGGESLAGPLAEFGSLWEERLTLQQELARLQGNERNWAQRQDMLRYQLKEIDEARLSPGEDDDLQRERDVLAHAERLREQVVSAYTLAAGGDDTSGAVDLLGQAVASLEEAVGIDQALSECLDLLAGAQAQVQEATRALRRYVDGLAADPARLTAVEGRLDEIEKLRRKYGDTVEAILAYRTAAQDELAAGEGDEERRTRLAERIGEIEASLVAIGHTVHAERRRVAAVVEDAVQTELRELAMGSARFQVAFDTEEDADGLWVDGTRLRAGKHGWDRVRFLFSANEGEPPKPLAKVASGGEMSRFMLALKSQLARVDDVPLLVFDEVDAGIGGATAKAVGERLRRLAEGHQVICITHLAQIASMAHRQVVVSKDVVEDRTVVGVRPIDGEQRVAEIARMLDGTQSTTTQQRARELLEEGGGGTGESTVRNGRAS